jgi:hypothetical protein
MAVDLVLRLCQVDEADGGLPGAGLAPDEPGYDSGTAHIAINDFCDGLWDIFSSVHTDTQLKTFYSMPTNQQNQFDSLWDEIVADDPDGGPPSNELIMARLHRFRSILTKHERKDDLNLAAYDTADDIQTWFMEISEIDLD